MKHVIAAFLVLAVVSTTVLAQNRETRNVGTFSKISFRVPGKLYLRQGSPQKVEIEGDKSVIKEIETEVEGTKLIIGKDGKWFDWDDDERDIKVYVTVKDLDAISVSGSGDLIAETKFIVSELELNVSGSGSLRIETEVNGPLEAKVSGSGNIDLKGKCRNFESGVSGSGKIIMAVAISEVASFNVSGSGKIMASGSSPRVKASISGSGKVLAGDLSTNNCDVRISGSGDVEINVKDELEANISGSGSVGYRGNPNKINSHASGSGKVYKMSSGT